MTNSSILQSWMKNENAITAWLLQHEEEMIGVAEYLWNHPEIAYQETLSSKCLGEYLEKNGFEVEWGTAGIATAFTAKWGSGRPYIGFLAEYDALAEIGHACGHNLFGTAVAGAACALKEELKSGTIFVYGCPAEEILSGKIFMNNAGVFDDLDLAVTWHPFDRNRVSNDIWQSIRVKYYTFKGRTAHAAKAPEEGRSALDAAELMNIGVNYLREHVPEGVRMHYAYKDNGIPANVVPDFAKTHYFIRSYDDKVTTDVEERVDNCARGAALMTGTTVDIELVTSCKEMKVNRVLTEIYYEAMTKIQTPDYTEEELIFAEQISKEAGLTNGGIYFQGLEPLEDQPVPMAIGTDVAEVSYKVPTITLSAATMCKGTPLHHWATTKQSGMSIGHKGMFYAARCMAEGTLAFLQNPENLQKAWESHRK